MDRGFFNVYTLCAYNFIAEKMSHHIQTGQHTFLFEQIGKTKMSTGSVNSDINVVIGGHPKIFQRSTQLQVVHTSKIPWRANALPNAVSRHSPAGRCVCRGRPRTFSEKVRGKLHQPLFLNIKPPEFVFVRPCILHAYPF